MTEKEKNQFNRPPIVVILGHIDHGKSSLLEAIRDFKITSKESGGITQHIGAYQIEDNGKKITFLDTPGHEAFSLMRSRGAKVADIAILVIDASEGIKPQTKEVIAVIKELKMPFIVALNKADKPEADPEAVKRELSKEDIAVESMGGKVPAVAVSAKEKKGIAELLEMILLVAEMEEFSSDIDKGAEGVVIESYRDELRGSTATLLLTEGTLKNGDIVGTPSAYTRIKSLEDFKGDSVEKAFPSDPVVVFGFDNVPMVGEAFKVFPDQDSAQEHLKQTQKKKELLEISDDQKNLNIILKTDVLGSTEAIGEILKQIPQDKVVLRIVKSEVGSVNESDIKLAKGRRVLVVSFRAKVDPIAQKMAERERVKILKFDIIYDLVEEIRKFMEKLVEPEDVRLDLGRLRVLAVFLTDKNRQVVGGRVAEGEIRKGSKIEILRNEEFAGKGRLVNLQKNKKDVGLVSKGDECGIVYEGEEKIEQGDTLVFYVEEKKKGTL